MIHVMAWLLVCAAGLAAPEAPALQRRAILGVEAAGDWRVELDPPMYGASATRPRFQDVRLFGPAGQEVPYVLRAVAPGAPLPAGPAAARVLDPVLLPDGSSRAVLDLEGLPGPHAGLELTLSGQDYLRAVRVESSLDGREFGLLAEGAYVFDVATGGPRAQRSRVSFPATHARYLRVSLLPGRDGQPLQVLSARVEAPDAAPAGPPWRSLALAASPASLPVLPGEPRRSAWTLADRPPGLPLTALALAVEDEEFVRRVRVEATTRGEAWFEVGGGVIYRVRRAASGFTDESLEVWLEPGERPRLRLIVLDGDDPPLRLTAVRGLWLPEELVFRARQAGPHELRLGDPRAQAPRYDLAELLARGSGGEPRPCSLGPLEPLPVGPVEAGPDTRPWSEKHALLLQLGIGALALALLAWTLRLLFRPRPKS
ncbi:MAG TPA: DUF3999 family protein [Myxococcota bacterium]|nr:DUF3999 family protein [Myxococcota bacterium]HRY94860.1 DUF3999 family protein [Myxococcota bacterium]HSA23650.1 DUF3999 family protein [Myxococcota bacterium]